MTTKSQSENEPISKLLRNENIDQYIFIALVAASFIGELMMKTSMLFGFIYWMIITPFFFFTTLLSEKAKNIRTGRETKYLLKYEFLYWGSAFVAVILVFLLWDLERIGPSEASIVIHIILSHTMFLTGIVLGLRFYLIGILLFITATLSITTEFTIGFSLDVVVVILITWVGLKIKNQFYLPIFKRESDFTKPESSYSGNERRHS